MSQGDVAKRRSLLVAEAGLRVARGDEGLPRMDIVCDRCDRGMRDENCICGGNLADSRRRFIKRLADELAASESECSALQDKVDALLGMVGMAGDALAAAEAAGTRTVLTVNGTLAALSDEPELDKEGKT